MFLAAYLLYGIDEISCENAYFKIKNPLSEFISIHCDFVTCEILKNIKVYKLGLGLAMFYILSGKFYCKVCLLHEIGIINLLLSLL